MTDQPTPLSTDATASAPKTVIVYSTSWCGDCRRSKNWLKTNGIAFTDIDIEVDEAAALQVQQLNNGQQSVPTIVFPDGAILVEPSNRQLAVQAEQSLGITTPDSARARGANQG